MLNAVVASGQFIAYQLHQLIGFERRGISDAFEFCNVAAFDQIRNVGASVVV
jgi:hypothetical protein